MRHKIYFSICGEGYGHSSRSIAIAKELTHLGADVLMGSYGYVLERLSTSFDTVEIKREFEMVGNNGSFDLKKTITRSSGTAFLFSKIISDEKKVIKNFDATCVVADGRCAAVFAAFKLGIPCVIISNQTSLIPFFDDTFLLRLIGKPIEFTLMTMNALADEVLIPDFPPPNTVCFNTLSKKPYAKKKQRFIGPVVALNHDNEPSPIKTPFILTLLGGHTFRFPIFEGILNIADKFPEINFIIFTKFKSNDIPGNVKVFDFAKDISSYMRFAEIIITQAGHSTAMEILTLGKPALIIPDKGQIEQENNATRMKELGVCDTLDYNSLDQEKIFEKIYNLLNDIRFRKKAIEFSYMASKMRGSQKAAQIIIDLSERMSYY